MNTDTATLTAKFLSCTSGTIHTNAQCCVTRARTVTNKPISTEQAEQIAAHPDWFKTCKRCA